MKIDSVHAEFMSGNAVSSTISTHSIVSRDASGEIHTAGVNIVGNSGTLFRYGDGTSNVYGGCNNSEPWFGTSSENDLRLVTDSSERMRIDKTGNVGIGATAPDTKLTVSIGDITTSANIARFHSSYDSANNGYLTIDENNHTPDNNDWTGYGTRIQKMTDVTYQGYIEFNPVGGQYATAFGMGNTEYMRIANGGNVGIGVTSPSNKLHVETNVSDNQQLRIRNNNTTHRAGIGILNRHGHHFNVEHVGHGSNVAIIENYSTINSGIQFYAKGDGEYRFYTTDSNNERMRILNNGNVGIGATNPTSPLHIIGNDTDANAHFTSLFIDHNCSGGGTNTSDYNHTGILVDVDSTATGGNTTHEHRIYGIRSDTRHSGDSDLCYGVYSYTRSDHTSGTCTELRAMDAYAVASAAGTNTNMYGVHSKCLKDSGSTGTTAKMFGVRGEVEVDAGTCTNAYAFQSNIDRDGGTITTGYLYYGSYSGTVNTKWGLYLTGETKNYFSGDVGVGTTSPAYKLDVHGSANVGTLTATTISGPLTGNASTASKFASNVLIGGVSFDGSGPIDLPGVNSLGTQNTTGRAETSNTAVNSDTVDSLHAHQFLRSDADDTCTGSLYVSGASWNNNLGWMAWRALSHAAATIYADDTELKFYVSIRGHHYIRASAMVVTSDERVKTDIQTLDPEIALSKLEKIRPVSYKMKETGQFTFGFIGQEIEKELPNVVNKSDGTLVDLNIMGEFSNKQSIKYQFEDEEKDVFIYTLTLENPIPSTFDVDKVVAISASSVTGNSSGFLYDPEYCGKPEIGGTVMKLLHETELIEEGRYKIIGTETDDFRTLDYNEIFTLTTAALKEVNEQLQAEKIKTANLTARVEDLEAMVSIIKLNMTWPDA